MADLTEDSNECWDDIDHYDQAQHPVNEAKLPIDANKALVERSELIFD